MLRINVGQAGLNKVLLLMCLIQWSGRDIALTVVSIYTELYRRERLGEMVLVGVAIRKRPSALARSRRLNWWYIGVSGRTYAVLCGPSSALARPPVWLS